MLTVLTFSLFLSSCTENGYLVDPKGYLGQVPPSVSEMDERERSSALRSCLALRSYRLKSYLRSGPRPLRAHVVQKQCHETQKMSYMKTVFLDQNNGVLELKRTGRFLASETVPIPSNRMGRLGKICSDLLAGKEAQRKNKESQLHFIAKDGEDIIMELRGRDKIKEVISYKVQTNSLHENFGSIVERQQAKWCGLDKQIQFNIEVYLSEGP